MKKVLPNVTAVELTRDHPIFHLVYELQGIPRGAFKEGEGASHGRVDARWDHRDHRQGW